MIDDDKYYYIGNIIDRDALMKTVLIMLIFGFVCLYVFVAPVMAAQDNTITFTAPDVTVTETTIKTLTETETELGTFTETETRTMVVAEHIT